MRNYKKDKIASRKNMSFILARTFSNLGYKFLARVHLELARSTVKLKREDTVFLYIGLHKSLWETTGVLSALYKSGLPIPYAGMGDNLVQGKFFRSLARQAGVFLIKRAMTRRDILESAKMLKNYIINFMAHGVDVMIYPEGTRKNIPDHGKYGNFFPTVFEAVLEYEKTKDKIVVEHKDLSIQNSYIIPFNTDYSMIREIGEMVHDAERRAFTLSVFDSLKMLKNIKDTYISFGSPIKVADVLGMSRKELSREVRNRCLELVKILPINIVSRSIVDEFDNAEDPGNPVIGMDSLKKRIKENIGRLIHLQDRFRNFTVDDEPGDILKKVAKYDRHFIDINIKNVRLYKLYADYIGHYFNREGA